MKQVKTVYKFRTIPRLLNNYLTEHVQVFPIVTREEPRVAHSATRLLSMGTLGNYDIDNLIRVKCKVSVSRWH